MKFWLILTFITVSNKAVIKCWWLWISPGYYIYRYMKLEDRTKINEINRRLILPTLCTGYLGGNWKS